MQRPPAASVRPTTRVVERTALRHGPYPRRAFTLVELMIALGLAIGLAALVMVSLEAPMSRVSDDQARRLVPVAGRAAQAAAARLGVPVDVRAASSDGRRWQVVIARADAPHEPIEVFEIPEGVAFVVAAAESDQDSPETGLSESASRGSNPPPRDPTAPAPAARPIPRPDGVPAPGDVLESDPEASIHLATVVPDGSAILGTPAAMAFADGSRAGVRLAADDRGLLMLERPSVGVQSSRAAEHDTDHLPAREPRPNAPSPPARPTRSPHAPPQGATPAP